MRSQNLVFVQQQSRVLHQISVPGILIEQVYIQQSTMKPNLLPFIRERWQGVPDPKASFVGKFVVITGANSGVGLAAAEKFVSLGAEKVILGVRNLSKGKAAQKLIEDHAQRRGVAEIWELDMDSYTSIHTFAKNMERNLSRLDVLILNAGVNPVKYKTGPEGWETHIQINVLGTALLGLLLLPKLRASNVDRKGPFPHLLLVTSEAHRWLEDKDIPKPGAYGGNLLKAASAAPDEGKKWDAPAQYGLSKLFTTYIANQLAALATRPSGEADVVVVSVCPGACKSELARDLKASGLGWSLAANIFEALFSKTAEEGAKAYIWAALLGKEAQGVWYKTRIVTT